PIRMEYSTTDISTEYESINDGSATEMTLHAYNNSVVPVPFMRASVQLNASEKAYASTAAGDFFPFTSAVIDGVLHSYVELSLGTYETQDMIVKERTRMLTNVANQVDNTGHITFSELPTAASTETDLSAVSETTATIQMHAWDGSQDMRTWTETTSANSSTTYSITNLYPERQYTVWVKGKVVDRIATTAQGVTQFSYKSPAKVRKFRLTIVKKRIAKQAAFLPAQEGGSHVRVYNDSRALQAFMAYDKTIIGGFESHWGDIDGDQKMELLVVPINGTRAPLKIFDDTGEELASIFPFGEQFEGGIVVVTGDIDNDEKEEIIVGPQSDYRSTMHVYTYNGELQQIEKIQTLQAFKDTQYTDGLMLQAGDINGKRGMEIIIAPRSTKQIIRVYRWSPSQQKLRSWKKYRPFTIDDQNATAGFSIATGDVNFDGKEEIVLGSLSGDSRIQVIAYKSKKQRLKQISSIYAFGKQFSGGVSLEVGNIRKNAKDEIVVVGKTNATLQNKIKVYSINAKNRLIHVSSVRPFGNIVDGGIALSLIDIDGDDKKELVTARSRGASDVHIFEPRGGKKMRELANFTVYDNSYESGLTISK
ncbi:MAG TPA: hypothetical protein VJB65_01940, partial [Patescibacteria group bacterium]|nr:hypothetical protein [Patescibacteria group bacterium]